MLAGVLAILVILLAATTGYFAVSDSGSHITSANSTVGSPTLIVPLRIFAAASLTPALESIQSAYQLNNSVSLIYNFASSGSLETQIAQGVPADAFLSADAANNVKLQNKTMLANGNSYATLIYNSIELFVLKNNPKNITTLADLLNPGVRIAIGSPASVPAGRYTLAVWQNIQSNWGNTSSADFESQAYANYSTNVMKHVVSQTTDVESAITQVLTGAADAAFGYVSDGIVNAAQLHAILVPSDVNVKAVYTISVIASTSHLVQANAFVAWLLSPSGQEYLAKWGFTPTTSP